MAKRPRSNEPDGRGARLVGSIVDPGADDGLGLTGPGAPSGLAGGGDHPVKARLLARARLARGEATDDDLRILATNAAPGTAPAPSAPARSSSPTKIDDPSPPTLPALISEHDGDDGDDDDDERPEPAPLTRRAVLEAAELPAPPALPSSTHTPSPGAVAEELDRIIGRSASGGGESRSRPTLSPNLVALMSALIGLSIMGTVGLFLEPDTFTPGHAAPTQPTAAPAPASTPAAALPAAARPVRKKIDGPWRIADDRDKAGHRVISGKIGKFAFLKAIEQAGLPKNEAYRAYGALKETLDLDHCHPKDSFRALVVGREKQLVAFEYEKSKEEVYQAKAGEDGKLSGKKLDLQVERNQIRRAFVHDGTSFDASAERAGFDAGLSQVAEQAFRGHLGLRELKAGDRLRVIAQEVTVLGEFARYAGIEAIEVLRNGKDPQRFYYFSHPEEGGYFDANGRAPYEGGWRKPIPGAPVTSKFNMKRMHPVLKKVMPHTGTDFGAPTGTPIGATAPGVVSFVGNGGPSGNLVKVKHDGGYESGYAHLSRFEAGLAVGDPVERLETVGYCGSTGRSTGPHLHFTMKKNGEYIDPESLNLDGLRVLGTAHRSAFAEVRQKYDVILEAIVLPEVPPSLIAQASTAPAGTEVDAHAAGDDEDLTGAHAETKHPSEGTSPDPAESPALAPPAPSGPSQPPPVAPSGKPASTVGGAAIFLTDADLLKMQSATHDGEVSE